MQKEWEEYFCLKTLPEFEKINKIVNQIYEIIFKENELVVLNMEKIINEPRNYATLHNKQVSLVINYDIERLADEFNKELNRLTTKDIGFNWKSLSDSCGGIVFLFAIIMSVIIVSMIF